MIRYLISASVCLTLFADPSAAVPEKEKGDPFVDRVVEFKKGQGGGFNEEKLPDIVIGCR